MHGRARLCDAEELRYSDEYMQIELSFAYVI